MSRNSGLSIVFRIAKTELASLFGSPIAWLILVVFCILASLDLSKSISSMAGFLQTGNLEYSLTSSIFLGMYGFFEKVAGKLFIYIPLLTMGLISREISSGSIKLVYSSPVTSLQLVLGKYLAAVAVSACLMAVPVLATVGGAVVIAHFDIAPMLVALLGLFLLICSYCAIGLLMSSLTSYQVVAAVSTLAVLALLGQIGSFGREYEAVRNITYWLSMNGRVSSFLRGVIRSDDLVYFICLTLMFVTLTVFRISFSRMGMGWQKKASACLALVAAVFCMAYLSSRPRLLVIADATRTRSNTITPESRKVIEQIDGRVVVNSYVNIMDSQSVPYLPTRMNPMRSEFEQYKLSKPDIEEHVIYYYAPVPGVVSQKRFEGKTVEEMRDFYLMTYGVNPAVFRSWEELDDAGLLKDEGFTFFRKISTEDGRSVILRNYNDTQRVPSEAEMTAAFAKLYAEMPAVAFLSGNGERSLFGGNPESYHSFSVSAHSRNALVNQGFDVCLVSPDEPISDSLNIVVIADPSIEFSDAQMDNVRSYLDRGGNMLILADYGHQHVLNPLLAEVGLKLSDRQIAVREKEQSADLVLARPRSDMAAVDACFSALTSGDIVVTMPGCLALDTLSASNGFRRVPAMRTIDSAWLEDDWGGFRDDAVECGAGESCASFCTAYLLTREAGGRSQRVMVLGDADCFCDGEMAISRDAVTPFNFTLINRSFKWLSGGQFPVDVVRSPATDTTMRIGPSGADVFNALFVYVIPAVLAALGVFVLLRRRRA